MGASLKQKAILDCFLISAEKHYDKPEDVIIREAEYLLNAYLKYQDKTWNIYTKRAKEQSEERK